MSLYVYFNLLIFFTYIVLFQKFLHIYQLKDYNNIRYLKHFINKKTLFVLLCSLLFVFELLIKNILLHIVINVILYIANLFYLKNLIKNKKTPLKFTKKLSRIYIISIIFLLTLSFYKYSFILFIVLSPVVPILANTLNLYDKIKNFHYIKKASLKIKNHSAQVIAITGSNGKTSVKNILLNMLSTQYKTQATPASYNTPLGIAKFINNELKHDTEFLILEYGARHKKDIKTLCKIYGANYGIVTTISAQHLESFKHIENIFLAKNELPKYLQNQTCVFNIDNLYCLRMYNFKTGNKTSISINTNADIFAKNIQVTNFQTTFNLIINKKNFLVQTSILGRHNITNICLATALAKSIGVSNKNIISSIKNLQPTPHRLQLIKTHINILDDSYNCSPASAKEALWILKNLPGKKMIATPGIIECGKQKYNINFNLGKQMSYCDYCIIIGNENKQAILEGITKPSNTIKKPLPEILFANTLEDAKQYFKKLATDDTLLLLNDLPDDYK